MKRWGARVRIVIFGIVLIVTLFLPAAFANDCSKGKPCGNTCINVHYTCHVGSNPTASSAPTLTPAPYTAQVGDLPNPTLTPGDVLTTDVARICTPGYSKTVRDVPESLKTAVYREYGITHHAPYSYEVDHLVSLELGGSNSIRNLWPESYTSEPLNAHVKDRLENKLHELVCNGKLSLATAQHQEAADWIQAYIEYVGPLPTR
ncbi:MAG: hypothetical protein P8Y02_05735 [Deinococcales bacterium]|jgi:hypothetical protein